MPKPFQESQLGAEKKVERAKRHIRDLEILISVFKKGIKPPIKKANTQLGQHDYVFTETNGIGYDIPMRIGEVLQNLRSALDYIVCALILNNNCVPTRHSGFPIATDADEYERIRNRKIQGVRQDVANAIDEIKPYKCNGCRELWMLRRLNDREKHRLLVAAAIGFRATKTTLGPRPTRTMSGGRRSGGVQIIGPTVWDADVTPAHRVFPLKNGQVFFSQPLDVNEDPKFLFDVAFNEPEVIQGDPVLPTLHQLTQLVDGMVTSLAGFLV